MVLFFCIRTVELAPDDFQQLKALAQSSESLKRKNTSLEEQNNRLRNENANLTVENQDLKKGLRHVKEERDHLKTGFQRLQMLFDKMKDLYKEHGRIKDFENIVGRAKYAVNKAIGFFNQKRYLEKEMSEDERSGYRIASSKDKPKRRVPKKNQEHEMER